MADTSVESMLSTTSGLLSYYSYGVSGYAQEFFINRWLENYSPEWVRLALIESLYRGRYKMISVKGLLADWERRGYPIYHFNREFEALICHNFPQISCHKELSLQDTQCSSGTLMINDEVISDDSPSPSLSQSQPASETKVAQVPFDRSATNVGMISGQESASTAEVMIDRSDDVIDEVGSSQATPFSIDIESVDPAIDVDSSPMSTATGQSMPHSLEATPIDRFIPDCQVSELCQKLISMAFST